MVLGGEVDVYRKAEKGEVRNNPVAISARECCARLSRELRWHGKSNGRIGFARKNEPLACWVGA